MTDQPGCGCEICVADYQLAMIHDYVWEPEDEDESA